MFSSVLVLRSLQLRSPTHLPSAAGKGKYPSLTGEAVSYSGRLWLKKKNNGWTGYNEEFVRIGPKKYFLQKGYLAEAANIYNFPVRSDDTFVVTYPKSGTTMVQEAVWLICNNLDYEKAQLNILNERFVFLEVSSLVPTEQLSYTQNQRDLMKNTVTPRTVRQISEMPSPRFIKSHLPLSLLPQSLLDNTKVVYMARDPRDITISYFYHHKLMKMMKPDRELKPFWKFFVSDNIFWAPYFKHVLEAWEKRNHPNLLFLFYEDMIKDLPGTIRRLSIFLNKVLTSEEVDKLSSHLHIDNFKKNKSVNLENLQENGVITNDGAFIRKGKSGEWRDYFDEEMTAEAEEWIVKNIRDTDFRFPHF